MTATLPKDQRKAQPLGAPYSTRAMLVRGDRLADTLSDCLVRKIAASPTIRVVTNCEVVGLDGDRSLAGITARDRVAGEETRMATRRETCATIPSSVSHRPWAKTPWPSRSSIDTFP